MGVRTLFMSVSLRGFAKLASGVALLGGCNAILGIGSDYDVVPPKGGQAGSCSGNSCASGSSGAGGGTASGGKGGRGGKGGASGGGDATTGAGADAGGQGPVAGMDSSGGVPNAGTDGGGSPPEAGTAGDGNSGGGPNRDTVGVLGEPCAEPGDFGCEGHAQDQRLVCGDEKIWGHRSPCGPGTVCDTREDEAGACTPVVEECDGQAAGFSFCRNRQRFECGVDLITLALRQTCDYVCSGGACTGECTPEATDCGGGDDPESSLVPRTCQADGTWLDAAPCTSLCKAGGCVAATCGDNVQNGDETDRDCGGSCGRTCGVGKGCGGRGRRRHRDDATAASAAAGSRAAAAVACGQRQNGGRA